MAPQPTQGTTKVVGPAAATWQLNGKTYTDPTEFFAAYQADTEAREQVLAAKLAIAEAARVQAEAAQAAPKVPKTKGLTFNIKDGALNVRHTDETRFFQRFPWFALHRDQLTEMCNHIDEIRAYLDHPDLTTMESVVKAWVPKSARK